MSHMAHLRGPSGPRGRSQFRLALAEVNRLEAVGLGMPRLVEQDLAGARQLEVRSNAESVILGRAREFGALCLALRNGRLDVVAHQGDQVLERVRELMSLVRARGRVDSELAWPCLEASTTRRLTP